mgnify:CR=1 FL=1|tara:strand:- start:2806 stop:3153 length:348 start_codon:yes stop_codon:yes gene_type:complete
MTPKETKLWLRVFFLIVVVYYTYVGTTSFTRTIGVSQHIDYVSGIGRMLYASNMIVDTNNDVYEVSNSLLLLKMNAAENIAQLKPGKKYVVKGHGVRVPILSLYPVITQVADVRS